MRLRNKPWAQNLVVRHPESVIEARKIQGRINWSNRFSDVTRPLEVEIGAGKGRFITTLAELHPETNFVAVERQTTAAGMILRTKLAKKLTNLQIVRGDAENLTSFFGPHTVQVIYLNFSDPWPKHRHEKRRLTYKDFLVSYQQLLKEGGKLRFKTDNAGLFAYSLKSMNNFGLHFDFVSLDLHHADRKILAKNIETEYEHKFAKAGNPIYALNVTFKK